MSNETQGNRFHRARLTIQECSFPHHGSPLHRETSSISCKKISLAHVSTTLERKIKTNPEMPFNNKKIARYMNYMSPERSSQPSPDYFGSRLINLPAIRKSIREQEQKYTIEPIKSFSSTKLTVTPYHKIQCLISSKYSHQLEGNKNKETPVKRAITINQLKGDQIKTALQSIEKPNKWKEVIKNKKKQVSCKQHLNRVKNQMLIPEELTSYKCQEQTFNNTTFNLQLKNIIRFQFDASLHAPKQPKTEREENGQGNIEGWNSEHEQIRTSALFMY